MNQMSKAVLLATFGVWSVTHQFFETAALRSFISASTLIPWATAPCSTFSKRAMAVRAEVMEKVQVGAFPVHELDQPAKTHPASTAAVSVTLAPLARTVPHDPEVQVTPAPVTVPVP